MGYWMDYLGATGCREGDALKLDSAKYVFHGGILRQRSVYTPNQAQTAGAFGFKWARRDAYKSGRVQKDFYKWLAERYLQNDASKLKKWLFPGARVLDAGCGASMSALLLFKAYFNTVRYLGVDISPAVDVAKKAFEKKRFRGEFIQADLMDLPFKKPVFDLIFSEGVLHHTNSTEKAFKYLSGFLVKGGRFLFYVYARKSPIREFSDDLIRNYILKAGDKEAWDALMPLTKLGKIIGDLNITIKVPRGIPCLGIPKGPINLQRLFYWHIFKAYYKKNWNLEELNCVNYDWYRPLNCHRQTPEEVRKWCRMSGIKIEHMDMQESGITVVGVKR